MLKFQNANDAFKYLYKEINLNGIINNGTKSLYNIGFEILSPLDNKISIDFRKWNINYAEYEWQWYLSGNNNVSEIKKIAKIWDNMHSGDNIVNSNYGFQWKRNEQLDNIINKLKNNIHTRQAVISIYDGKEHELYKYDTPCTLSIHFQYYKEALNMTINMRSNDLWFGFCNDQYCFSKLQELICQETNIKIGTYYHFASNLHLYDKHLNKN